MRNAQTTLQRPLSRRLMPLAYALVAIVGLILALTWFALQVQITLAGFLNGESLWSKAQKQSVIDLDAYAVSGAAADLDSFRRNYAVLDSDRWARDAIASGSFDKEKVVQAFERGSVIPAAIPGMIFILEYFPSAPHINEALRAWHSTDDAIAELATTVTELQRAYAAGRPFGRPDFSPGTQRAFIRSTVSSVRRPTGFRWKSRAAPHWMGQSCSAACWLPHALRCCCGCGWRAVSWQAFAVPRSVTDFCSTVRLMPS